MEAYNFSAGASITTVHAEKEGTGTSVASAKTMAKSVFSIATNITSGSEENHTQPRKLRGQYHPSESLSNPEELKVGERTSQNLLIWLEGRT